MEDRGYLYGDGAMETIRVHRGAPFRFPRHLARLEESLRILGLPAPTSQEALVHGARSTVEANGLKEGLLRITVTAPANSGAPGHVTMTVRTLPNLPRETALAIADEPRRVPGPLTRCKTISRAAESAALRWAAARGAFDAVLLNVSGRVAETTARNIFVVADGEVLAPDLSEGALPGVTRSAVIEGAGSLGLPCRETTITTDALLAAEEVFLTGSGVGVLGVARIGEQTIPRCPGPATTALAAGYADLVERDARW